MKFSERLDQALVSRGLAESRNKALALVMAGRVRVNGQVNYKADAKIKPEDAILIEENPETRYVSRGGLKLEGALKHFKVDVKSVIAADIGASTGGFTDCLLQHGAKMVYCVDVGKSQLAGKIRQDARVKLLENTNARNLAPEMFGTKPELAVIDVSFISIKKVLPALVPCLAHGGKIIALVKPQFECAKGETKKGIVKDIAVRERVLKEVSDFCSNELKLKIIGSVESSTPGVMGNIEYLLYLSL